MDADGLIDELAGLSIPDLRRMHAAAAALLAHYERTADPDDGRPAELQETYRQEYIRCGKPACNRCADGPGHRPYWYSYSRENGKVKKRYIGKERP